MGEDENDTQARPEKFLYVLMYVCLFTRRVWLRALRSKSAIGVAREVRHLSVRRPPGTDHWYKCFTWV